MEPDDLVPLIRAEPFQSFMVFTNDGASFEVRHPEQAMIVGETLYIAQDRKAIRCAMLNISRIETEEAVPPNA